MPDFTQEDAFELFGCGRTAVCRAALRQFNASASRHVERILAKRAVRANEYERGYNDGFSAGAGGYRDV